MFVGLVASKRPSLFRSFALTTKVVDRVHNGKRACLPSPPQHPGQTPMQGRDQRGSAELHSIGLHELFGKLPRGRQVRNAELIDEQPFAGTVVVFRVVEDVRGGRSSVERPQMPGAHRGPTEYISERLSGVVGARRSKELHTRIGHQLGGMDQGYDRRPADVLGIRPTSTGKR